MLISFDDQAHGKPYSCEPADQTHAGDSYYYELSWARTVLARGYTGLEQDTRAAGNAMLQVLSKLTAPPEACRQSSSMARQRGLGWARPIRRQISVHTAAASGFNNSLRERLSETVERKEGLASGVAFTCAADIWVVNRKRR